MIAAWRLMKFQLPWCSRDGRLTGLIAIGTVVTVRPFLPAWIKFSTVYEKSVVTNSRSAASRESARKPLTVSGTSVSEAQRTTPLPTRWSAFLNDEKCSTLPTWRSPITTSAWPARMGAIRRGIAPPGYWWSPSVLTMISAPRRSAASLPVWNARASPLRPAWRTTKSAPLASATATVSSVRPVIHDRHLLDAVDALDRARNIADDLGDHVGLVEHRDLYNQFHAWPHRYVVAATRPRRRCAVTVSCAAWAVVCSRRVHFRKGCRRLRGLRAPGPQKEPVSSAAMVAMPG